VGMKIAQQCPAGSVLGHARSVSLRSHCRRRRSTAPAADHRRRGPQDGTGRRCGRAVCATCAMGARALPGHR
jgi:hypothetical protein